MVLQRGLMDEAPLQHSTYLAEPVQAQRIPATRQFLLRRLIAFL